MHLYIYFQVVTKEIHLTLTYVDSICDLTLWTEAVLDKDNLLETWNA